MSPELLNPQTEVGRPAKPSDCYAFGMVIYEVLSGRVPFYQLTHAAAILAALQGNRPERPEGVEGVWFTDDIWRVLQSCWASQPSNRPSIEDALLHLEGTSIPPSPARLAHHKAIMETVRQAASLF